MKMLKSSKHFSDIILSIEFYKFTLYLKVKETEFGAFFYKLF